MRKLVPLLMLFGAGCSTPTYELRDTPEDLVNNCSSPEIDSLFELTRLIQPVVPIDAIKSKQGGWAVVSYSIQRDGTVSKIQLVDSSPIGLFDESALNAVEKFSYSPISANPSELAPSELNHCYKFSYKFV